MCAVMSADTGVLQVGSGDLDGASMLTLDELAEWLNVAT